MPTIFQKQCQSCLIYVQSMYSMPNLQNKFHEKLLRQIINNYVSVDNKNQFPIKKICILNGSKFRALLKEKLIVLTIFIVIFLCSFMCECKSIPSTVSQSTLHIQHHSMLKAFLLLKLSKDVPEKKNNININKTKY